MLICIALSGLTQPSAWAEQITSKQHNTPQPKPAPSVWWNAVNKGNLQELKKCMQQGNFLNELEPYTDKTALMIAILQQRQTIIEWLLQEKADLKKITRRRNTTLMAACTAGNVQVAQLALDAGVHPDVQGSRMKTAAHLAAQNGSLACIKLLLSRKANFQLFDSDDQTPLGLALQNGHIPIYRHLLAQGINPVDHQRDGEKLMIFALYQNQPQIMLELAQLGLDAQSTDTRIEAYAQAIELGYLQCAKVLLQMRRWKLPQASNEPERQLIDAIIAADSKSVRQLLESQSNQYQHDFMPIAIQFAKARGFLDFPVILRKATQNAVFARTHQRALQDNLMYAISNQSYVRAEACFHAGVNFKDIAFNQTILNSIKRNRDIRILTLLLDKGLQLNADMKVATASLNEAIYANESKYALLLLKAGCVPDNHSLHLAVKNNHPILVETLLKNQVDLDLTSYGILSRLNRLLTLARKHRSTETITILEKCIKGIDAKQMDLEK
tara:strand:- start:1689 stop:3182 length:1494 start_codon:yes stop_codon:yes gene_type:complete